MHFSYFLVYWDTGGKQKKNPVLLCQKFNLMTLVIWKRQYASPQHSAGKIKDWERNMKASQCLTASSCDKNSSFVWASKAVMWRWEAQAHLDCYTQARDHLGHYGYCSSTVQLHPRLGCPAGLWVLYPRLRSHVQARVILGNNGHRSPTVHSCCIHVTRGSWEIRASCFTVQSPSAGRL